MMTPWTLNFMISRINSSDVIVQSNALNNTIRDVDKPEPQQPPNEKVANRAIAQTDQ